MKIFYTILKALAVIVIVVTAVLFTGSFILQDKVTGVILKSFSKKISTKYEFKSVRLSFIRKFPKASLELNDVVVYSSPDYDKSCFAGINTDTLLTAKTVMADFSLEDVIKNVYDIERITLKEGRLNLFTDTAGLVNYDIYVEGPEQDSGTFVLNLDRINVSGLKAAYNNLSTKLLIKVTVESGRLKSRISGTDIDFSADGNLIIDRFSLYNFSISQNINAEIDVILHSSEKGVLFDRSSILLDGHLFGLTGFVSSEDVLDLTISGNKLDISSTKNYLPEKLQTRIAGYESSGILNVTARINGLVSRKVNPGINISFNVDKGNVIYAASHMQVRDLSFKGSFSNGPKMIPATSSLLITDLQVTLGSSGYTGSFHLYDFETLNCNLILKGKVIPAEIREFFNLKQISSAAGSIDFDLKMNGTIPRKDKYSLSDLLRLDPEADLLFDSFNIGLNNDNVLVTGVNGGLIVSDTLLARELDFTIRDHIFHANGIFLNFPGWLAGDPVILSGSVDLRCERLLPEKLFQPSAASVTLSGEKRGYHLPGDIILDVDFSIESLVYKTFSASRINGSLSYKPGIMNFKTLSLNSLDGEISGNGFLIQNTDKTFIGRGSFLFDNLDVNKAFTSFNNFGQTFIRSENLSGKLAGSLSLLMPMDSLLNPVIKSITAEGKYALVNGILKDFEPVRELSSFIELSELENISFEKLENDFFIRNNNLYVPQMDVKSSAANLSINGRHDFDNNYEYHIKILLSEALSKKIKKPKPNTSEFGAVEDDGLGRTSLLLKVNGNSDDLKVSYDIKAATSQVKSEIKSERKNLRTILNQEYGWFRNDSAPAQKEPQNSRRFRITWEETDSLKSEPEPSAVKKESVIKNIFKKK